MTAWFARAGLPFAAEESAAVGAWASSVAPRAQVTVTALASWREAADFLRATAFDTTWWDDEEEERETLWLRLAERDSEAALLRRAEAITAALDADVRGAAQAAVRAAGLEAAVADEATGMALLAAHQNALAHWAGEGGSHRFAAKYALFALGRWPLGYHAARLVVL